MTAARVPGGRRGLRPLVVSLPFTALVACGAEPSPAPLAVVVPSASARAAGPSPCARWPLEAGCVVALGATDDRLCALTKDRAFCWGATGRDPAPADVIEVERARAVRPERCTKGKTPEGVARCFGPEHAITIPEAPREGLSGPDDVQAIAVGREHACALVSGKVLCSGGEGSSLRGERGGSRGLHASNVVALPPVRDVVAIEGTTCALTTRASEVHCWGDGRFFPPGVLTPVAERVTAAAFVPEGDAGCFLGATGRVWCGASGDFGEVAALAGAKELASRSGNVCARRDGGRVSCWSPTGVTEAPGLAPAARLLPNVPCAVLEDGKLRCEAWTHRENWRTVEFPKGTFDLPSAVRAAAPHALLGPGACLLGEKGEVSCYGVIVAEWGTEPAMAGTTVAVLNTEGATKPVRVPGLSDVVELGPSCARTKDGKVWLIGVTSGPTPKKLRLSAASPKGADGAVALDPGAGACVGKRADGSRFRVVPPLLGSGPGTIGAPTVEPFEPDEEPLAPGLGPATLRHGRHHGLACALRVDAGVACRWLRRDGVLDGPVFDPLFRSTLPLRVIPER